MSQLPADSMFAPRLARRRAQGHVFLGFCILASLTSIAILVALLGRVIQEGAPLLSWEFLTSVESQAVPRNSGIFAALIGTLFLMALTTLIAVPIGIGTAIYLNEYAQRSRLSRVIELNINNLAGVPSIVYGLLGLTIFVRVATDVATQMGLGQHPFGRSVLTGSLTMALLVLPVIIISAREALGAVPSSLRQAAYAMGATRWQTVWHHVLPAALPGILTGMILSLSRAIGEAAPLIVVGAVGYLTTVPGGIDSRYTVLPIQVFTWAGRPEPIYQQLSAAAIIVLLVVLFIMNGICTVLRAWQQQKTQL